MSQRNQLDFLDQAEHLVADAARETGKNLKETARAVASYAADRALAIAAASGEPGFDLVLKAEVDNVALFAGLSTVAEADSADARALETLSKVLSLGVTMLGAV